MRSGDGLLLLWRDDELHECKRFSLQDRLVLDCLAVR